MDVTLAEHANRFAAGHDGWEDVARAYAGISEPLFAAGVLALVLVGLVWRRRALTEAGVLALVAAGLGLAGGSLVAHLADRARPFVAHPQIHAFLHHAADPGFPSDHATAAFAIAGVLLLWLGARTLPVLLAAVALAVSRVLLGLHYPSDVLAGALLGSAAAIAVCVSARAVRARTAGAASRGAAASQHRAAAVPARPRSS
jgi:undecaprenyl-diphosphatase